MKTLTDGDRKTWASRGPLENQIDLPEPPPPPSEGTKENGVRQF